MATGLVIHISSGEDRHTEILTDDSVRIGVSESCDLRLRSSSVPKDAANSVLLELSRANGSYRVSNFDTSLALTLNGEPVESGTQINDGDEVRIKDSEVVLHFYPVRALPAVVPASSRETHVAPFIEAAAIESAATARRDDAKVFLRQFTRELISEINPSTKFVTLAIALILVGGTLYLGFAMYKEIQRSRRLIDEQRAQLKQMQDQVLKTNDQLVNIDQSTRQLQNSLSLAVKLRSEYGSGVCLIAGS
jgi:pSer/pThr/pTyr-binding forkhead associated (FHA) protein